MSRDYHFFSNCVDWPRDKVQDLQSMIDAKKDITRKTFLRHVDKEELREIEHSLHYSNHYRQGMTMAQDYHVTYHTSICAGKRVYFFRHSCIEFVFMPRKELLR